MAECEFFTVESVFPRRAFESDGWIFGVAYFVVGLLPIGTYAMVSRTRRDAELAG